MNVYTDVSSDETRISIVLKSRDDLERAIPWLPTLRVLFPYPEPPPEPKSGEFENMGSAAPSPFNG